MMTTDSAPRGRMRSLGEPHFIVGLGGSDHDGSAALLIDGDIKVAVEEERLTRVKYGMSEFYQNPVSKSVAYCLSSYNVLLDEVVFVSSDLLPARVRFEYRDRPLHIYPHHLCHAAAAYMLLPPASRAAVVVYDGAGSILSRIRGNIARNKRETFSFFHATPEGITLRGRTFGTGVYEHDDFPSAVNNSVGFFFEFISSVLGFGVMGGGKTMGLSAHGEPRFRELLERFIRYGARMDSCFECELDSPELRTLVENVLRAERGSFCVKADLAASAQAIANQALLNAVTLLDDEEVDYLCISGGCAINTVANSYLVTNNPLDVPVLIPPHAGDAGLGLGALWLWAKEQGLSELTFRGQKLLPAIARPGKVYSQAECERAVQSFYPRLARDACVREPSDLAREIAEGAIVGIFNGGSEIGPRALGGRSILADPRKVLIREKINREMKLREPFRPLAPMVLEEHYQKYFHDPRNKDAFMLKVALATDRCMREAPAVVHIDGTARVQVVGPDDDEFLRALLTSFLDLTDLPMLLNTSFNRRGEPIVETPLDAVDCFLGLKIDGLFMNGVFYRSV